MKYIPIYRVALVREATHKALTRMVTCPQNAYDLLHEYLGDVDREHYVVLLMDTRNQVIGIHTASIGSLNAAIVHPRETYKAAILANASAVILGHNHPSGDPSPSKEDLALSMRMKEVGELLGIPVMDHIIIGDGSFVSLKERGLL